jgi:putative photosynthetic complex assembly protein
MSATVNRVPPNRSAGFPAWALAGAGGAVVLTIIAAAIGGSPTVMPPAAVLATRMLTFDDQANGAVRVIDAQTGRDVAMLAPGTNGFIRATLRGLSHSGGHEEHVRANHPFRVTTLSDGRITLVDKQSGRTLDLEAFGSLNAGAFAALVTAPEKSP